MPERLAKFLSAMAVLGGGLAWVFTGDWHYGLAGLVVVFALAMIAEREN